MLAKMRTRPVGCPLRLSVNTEANSGGNTGPVDKAWLHKHGAHNCNAHLLQRAHTGVVGSRARR